MADRRLTREEQRARTVARLLDAAAVVFARDGFAGAALDDIAAHAGFTKGAVYSNFASKEDLFLAVLERHIEQRLSDVERTFGRSTTLEDVRDGGRELAGMVVDERDLWLLFVEFWAHAARRGAVGRQMAEHYARWRRVIGTLIERQFADLGLPLGVPAEDLAAGAIALTEGFALQKLLDPDRVPDRAFGEMLAALVAGVAATGVGLDVESLHALRDVTGSQPLPVPERHGRSAPA